MIFFKKSKPKSSSEQKKPTRTPSQERVLTAEGWRRRHAIPKIPLKTPSKKKR